MSSRRRPIMRRTGARMYDMQQYQQTLLRILVVLIQILLVAFNHSQILRLH